MLPTGDIRFRVGTLIERDFVQGNDEMYSRSNGNYSTVNFKADALYRPPFTGTQAWLYHIIKKTR